MLDFTTQKKQLQPLLKHPYNQFCADCDSRSPTWASLNFGVFLCSNCSGAHRALGPTITRVKSANLDLWHTDWIADMVLGNKQINSYWEADPSSQIKKPKASASQQEVKRYSIDKYLKKKFVKDLSIPDPLTAFKKGIVVPIENNEKKQQKLEQQKHSVQIVRQPPLKMNKDPAYKNNQPKKEISLLQFDITPCTTITPPPAVVNYSNQEEQFTQYTQHGTSFTSETSKESGFVDFNSLLQSHNKPVPPPFQHSYSTQQIYHQLPHVNSQPNYHIHPHLHHNPLQPHQNPIQMHQNPPHLQAPNFQTPPFFYQNFAPSHIPARPQYPYSTFQYPNHQ